MGYRGCYARPRSQTPYPPSMHPRYLDIAMLENVCSLMTEILMKQLITGLLKTERQTAKETEQMS